MSDLDANLKYMFDIEQPSADPGITARVPYPGHPDPPEQVPLERLEAQICELAGHLAAATCRFLVLLADFDARRGWASWEMNSCAACPALVCESAGADPDRHPRTPKRAWPRSPGR